MQHSIPLLADFLPLYVELRAEIVAAYPKDIDWSENVHLQDFDADIFGMEYVHVVLNSGMKWKVAQCIWDRVRPYLDAEREVPKSAFGHDGKRNAINAIWNDRRRWFEKFLKAKGQGADAVLAFCVGLPWIGHTTKYHLAKNLGVDCAKPDRHLERIAAAAGTDPHTLCRVIHEQHGDRIATVDYVLWRCAEMGIL